MEIEVTDEMIAATLAIFKAGAAEVALGITTPEDVVGDILRAGFKAPRRHRLAADEVVVTPR